MVIIDISLKWGESNKVVVPIKTFLASQSLQSKWCYTGRFLGLVIALFRVL